MKKGQAGIIVIVVLILLILAAIIILWVVLSKTVKEKSGEVKVNPILLNGDIEYTMYEKDASGDYKRILVKVKRGQGGGDITGIQLVFEDYQGNSYLYENLEVYPLEFETIDYDIGVEELVPDTLIGFNKIKSISLHYIYGEGSLSPLLQLLSTEKGYSSSPKEVIMYEDNDDDRYGSGVCGEEGIGCVLKKGDCDDEDENINPGAIENLNGVDENCDGFENIYSCGNLNFSAIPYILEHDILVPIDQHCFMIRADNVVFDLDGHTIESEIAEGYCTPKYCEGYSDSESCENNVNCQWYPEGLGCEWVGCDEMDEEECSVSPKCEWDSYDLGCLQKSCEDYSREECDWDNCEWSSGEGLCKSVCEVREESSCKSQADCNWVVVPYTLSAQIGIAVVSKNNVTVKNGKIKNLAYPIYLYSQNHRNRFQDLDIEINSRIYNPWGIYLRSSNNNSFQNIDINFNSLLNGRGVYSYASSGNSFKNIKICGTMSYNFLIQYSNNNVYESTTCDSSKIANSYSIPAALCTNPC